jgi:hypothetical protein
MHTRIVIFLLKRIDRIMTELMDHAGLPEERFDKLIYDYNYTYGVFDRVVEKHRRDIDHIPLIRELTDFEYHLYTLREVELINDETGNHRYKDRSIFHRYN